MADSAIARSIFSDLAGFEINSKDAFEKCYLKSSLAYAITDKALFTYKISQEVD